VTLQVRLNDPIYESAKVVAQLTDAERAAGGLPTIAGRDRYTSTKIRTAFCEAYRASR
jgi:hypothetical protein